MSKEKRFNQKVCPKHFKKLRQFARMSHWPVITKDYMKGTFEGMPAVVIRTNRTKECGPCIELAQHGLKAGDISLQGGK